MAGITQLWDSMEYLNQSFLGNPYTDPEADDLANITGPSLSWEGSGYGGYGEQDWINYLSNPQLSTHVSLWTTLIPKLSQKYTSMFPYYFTGPR